MATGRQFSVREFCLMMSLWLMVSNVAFAQTIELTYEKLASKYKTSPPEGFLEFSRQNGVEKPNTCAVRLSFALSGSVDGFFGDVDAQSGVQWKDLPTRADDLAIILNGKIGNAKKVSKDDLKEKHGIIFFDTIQGFPGSGHISLWNGQKVVDGGDFFERSPRVYFWLLK